MPAKSRGGNEGRMGLEAVSPQVVRDGDNTSIAGLASGWKLAA